MWRWDSEPFGSDEANEDPDGDGVRLGYGLRFPGQYYDGETEYHYNYFRDYDPEIGRYMESDPAGIVGGQPYSYAMGAPHVLTDRLGLWSEAAHNHFINSLGHGYASQELAWIAEGSAYADTGRDFQNSDHSFMHAMSSSSLSKEQAKAKWCEFISAKMKAYEERKNSPDEGVK